MITRINNHQFRLFYLILSSLFAALTAIGAFLRIPVPYVPFALSDFFVLLSGSILGPYYGCLSQFVYIAVGFTGIPVFVHGGGPAYVFQPTFGYLIGFPIAAFLVGKIIRNLSNPETGSKLIHYFIAHTAAMLVIFTLGISGLFLNIKFIVGKNITFTEAFHIGGLLFIAGIIIKITICSLLAYRLGPFLRGRERY